MNRRSRPFAFLFVLLAACAAGAPAPAAVAEEPWPLLSAWTLERGGYYVQGAFAYRKSAEFYDPVGEKLEGGGDLRDFTATAHVEYGLRDALGFYFVLPVRSLEQQLVDDSDLSSTGIGDLSIGFRYRLRRQPALSLQPEVTLPTGYNATFRRPRLGEGHTDFTLRLVGGHALESKPLFVQAAAGYRVRTGGPANQMLVDLDAGGWVAQRVRLAAHWEWNNASGEGELVEHFKGGAQALARVGGKIDALAGVARVFGGANVPAGTQLFLGLTYRGNLLPRHHGLLAAGGVAVESGAGTPAEQREPEKPLELPTTPPKQPDTPTPEPPTPPGP